MVNIKELKVGDKLNILNHVCGNTENADYIVITKAYGELGGFKFDGFKANGIYVNQCLGCYTDKDLQLIKEGESVEEVKLAEYVRVERNTELFKKGSVFKFEANYNYYRSKDNSIFIDEGQKHMSSIGVIAVDTVQRLPKVFVPVIKFNPEFVTEEENKRLQDALTQKSAKKAITKTKRSK